MPADPNPREPSGPGARGAPGLHDDEYDGGAGHGTGTGNRRFAPRDEAPRER